MSIITEISEGLFAAIARAIIIMFTAMIPGASEWWEVTEWRNLITFGVCVFAGVGMWALVCPLDISIPVYNPRCGLEGFLLDGLYPGILAYLLNYVGVEVFNWTTDKVKRWLARM